MRKVIFQQPEQNVNVVVEGDLIGSTPIIAFSKNEPKGFVIRTTSGWQIASTHSVRLSNRFYETRAELMKSETEFEFFTP